MRLRRDLWRFRSILGKCGPLAARLVAIARTDDEAIPDGLIGDGFGNIVGARAWVGDPGARVLVQLPRQCWEGLPATFDEVQP